MPNGFNEEKSAREPRQRRNERKKAISTSKIGSHRTIK